MGDGGTDVLAEAIVDLDFGLVGHKSTPRARETVSEHLGSSSKTRERGEFVR